ncbi:hypothetical protein SAMN02910289_01517 [Lachnospiraceae bacterium RM5]|nr:hypothetical protein SAMN02910289_01517 [Lachnospiraceae bacterium RM5]
MYPIFDIIAELCSYIIKTCPEDFFVKYSCLSSVQKSRIDEEIEENLSFLFGEENIINFSDLENTEINDKIKEYFEILKNREDYPAILRLIQILDKSLKCVLKEIINEFQRDNFSVALNSNRESTGLGLLPRCFCVWERKNRLSHSYNRMDNFLTNLLLMENDILGDLIDKHFFLSNEMFREFGEKGTLKVAASPLSTERHFDVKTYEKDNVMYYEIVYETNEDKKENPYIKDNELIWSKIKDCKSDIIIFPEMMGNPYMVDFIQEKISRYKRDLEIDNINKLPDLIILPSFMEKNKNTVFVLNSSGEVICKQSKQNPYRAENGKDAYLEGIIANKVINIFHYEGIGRIAILICKDFLTTKYMEKLMRCFKLTLILVPSFSTGSYDFVRSFDLCAHDDCNVVWINTCASIIKGKEANFKNIGYVRKRISREDDESQMLCGMKICKNAFDGKCDKTCIYYETLNKV